MRCSVHIGVILAVAVAAMAPVLLVVGQSLLDGPFRWFRQWQNWACGEALGLITLVDGEQVRWFNADGLFVDTALIVRNKRG